MSNGNSTLFMPYGSVSVTFHYGGLHTLTRDASGAALGPAEPQLITPTVFPAPPAPEAPSLSPRQWQVLRLLVQGRSNKEIALTLGLAVGTVKIHTAVLFRKLEVSSRTAAAVAGARLLIHQDQPSTRRSKGGVKGKGMYPFGPGSLDAAA
jgi:DNA-binding CsgD family transcriptional regulator